MGARKLLQDQKQSGVKEVKRQDFDEKALDNEPTLAQKEETKMVMSDIYEEDKAHAASPKNEKKDSANRKSEDSSEDDDKDTADSMESNSGLSQKAFDDAKFVEEKSEKKVETSD